MEPVIQWKHEVEKVNRESYYLKLNDRYSVEVLYRDESKYAIVSLVDGLTSVLLVESTSADAINDLSDALEWAEDTVTTYLYQKIDSMTDAARAFRLLHSSKRVPVDE